MTTTRSIFFLLVSLATAAAQSSRPLQIVGSGTNTGAAESVFWSNANNQNAIVTFLGDDFVPAARILGSGTLTVNATGTIPTSSAAFSAASAFATAAQGATADATAARLAGTGTATVTGAASLSGTTSGLHSGTSSGTNTGDQTITLTGAVTGTGTGAITTALSGTQSAAVTWTGRQIFSGTTNHNVFTATTATVSGSATFDGNVTVGDASGDTLTITAGTVTAANATSTSSGNNLVNLTTSDARYPRIYFAEMTSASSKTNDATRAAESALTLVLPVGTYIYEGLFRFTANGGNSSLEINGTGGGITASGWRASLNNGSGMAPTIGLQTSPNAGGFFSTTTNNDNHLRNGVLKVTVSSTVTVDWAQSSTSATTTTLGAGSYVRCFKIQ